MQQSIFELMYEPYKVKKPIRLIEFFAGYGSQALALKYLGVPFEHWKICEWAVKSIQAYKDIHFTNEKIYRFDKLSKDYLVDYLYKKGISSNYNEPMSRESIGRLSEDKLIEIYDNIQITHNLVNIQQVKAKDLEIKDTDEFTYLLTYSFPCQDLSLAGKGKGMSDTSTRSGMLWEVERILTECKDLGNMPEVLLMENVPQVHGKKNIEDFNKWKNRLEELGYKNFQQDLIATDYGIPQTRNRCFMVSILGDYSYIFPPKQELKLRLKDMLEDKVDEKYYLSDKMINFFYENEIKQKEKGNGFRFGVSDGNVIAKAVTTRAGGRMDDNFIKVKNATKKGYQEAYEGDGVNLAYPESKTRRGRVGEQVSQTLQTSDNMGVVENAKTICVNSKGGRNGIEGLQPSRKDRIYDSNGIAVTIATSDFYQPNYTDVDNLRIRKLTPKECGRLMGVKDEDIDKLLSNQSNASAYHCFGDSIVVNVLMAIFGEMM